MARRPRSSPRWRGPRNSLRRSKRLAEAVREHLLQLVIPAQHTRQGPTASQKPERVLGPEQVEVLALLSGVLRKRHLKRQPPLPEAFRPAVRPGQSRRLEWSGQLRGQRQQQLFKNGRALPPGFAGRARRFGARAMSNPAPGPLNSRYFPSRSRQRDLRRQVGPTVRIHFPPAASLSLQ